MTSSDHDNIVQKTFAVLGESQARKLLFEWNSTHTEFDEAASLRSLLDDQVCRNPDRIAVVFRDHSISYGELGTLTDRVAARLRAEGVGPEEIVAICVERSIEMVVTIWGVIKAGAAYLPIDPSFPAERIDFITRDSQTKCVLTASSLESRFAGLPAVVLDIDAISSRNEPDVVDTAIALSERKNLAYLTYTSGSTGKPKGVMVERGNVLNFLAGMDKVLGTMPGTWLAVTSISFDISVLELLWTLTRGFTVVVQAENDRIATSGEYSVSDQLIKHNVTHLQCTPTLAKMLARSDDALNAMKSLRVLLLGGEPLPLSLIKRLTPKLRAKIYNMYGPTETTVWSTCCSISAEDHSVSIGRPLSNTQIYLLDEAGLPVPVGEVGELHIGGDGVARGYWKREDLTATRFVSNPFSKDATARLYRTGDLARYRSDGTIEFLGRADDQVKINGYRVELGEIESVLSSHPCIQEAVAAVQESSAGISSLMAYAVLKPSMTLSTREMQIFARRKLPTYMVPSNLVPIDRIPVTPNGKTDRRALPSVVKTNIRVDASSTSQIGLENSIVTVWQDVLGLDEVSVNQNLFDLGATSLMVAEVATKLSEILGQEVRVTELFAYPTINSLITFIRNDDSLEPKSSVDRGALRREALLRRTRNARGGSDRQATAAEGKS